MVTEASAVPSKRCCKCRKMTPLAGFSKNRSSCDGLQKHCKECQRSYTKSIRERKANYAKEYRRAHRDELREKEHKRYHENADSSRARAKEQYWKYRQKEPQRILRWNQKAHLLRKYGMTVEDYDALLEKQNGVCAICGRPNVGHRAMPVDHDHQTGQIRGLLCNKCNTALGQVDDSIGILRKMIAYIELHQREDHQQDEGQRPGVVPDSLHGIIPGSPG